MSTVIFPCKDINIADANPIYPQCIDTTIDPVLVADHWNERCSGQWQPD